MLISRQILERAGIELVGEWDEWLPPVTIDSRSVVEGGAFWALTTGQRDGHEFVGSALEAGAKIVAVNREYAAVHPDGIEDRVLFVMDDTLEGLQNLAKEVRRSVGAETFALTGSNGKTTTRELVAAALSTADKTVRSPHNFNNHIGVPLTILNLEGDERFLVLEMGANHPGEIAALCQIGHPEAGLITNIGDAHVGEFGGPEALQAAKGELFGFLREHDGLAIVNLDDDKVVQVSSQVNRRVGYSLRGVPDGWTDTVYLGRLAEMDAWSRATLEVEGLRVQLQLPGRHWALAALGAFATAVELGADAEPALEALGKVRPLEGRGRILDLGDGVELLDDSYNANTAAVEAALNTLLGREGMKIAVLGDILELGEYEVEEHQRVGRLEQLDAMDLVFFVGERMAVAADEAEAMGHTGVTWVPDDEVGGLAERLQEQIEPGAGLVVKGSRLVGLEKVVQELSAKRGASEGGEA